MKKNLLLFFAIISFFYSENLFSAEPIPPELQNVGIEEKLGTLVHKELKFKDEQGQEVSLDKYFQNGRPVIVTLVYFECPNLCGLLLNGFIESLNSFDWSVGDKFDVVTVSIDPNEGADLAKAKKESVLKAYTRPGAIQNWHFLTGTEDQIKQLASDVGFNYRYDEDQKQYAHAAGIFVLTPSGKLSRTLYGIQFPSRDLKLALLEASEGKIGTLGDRLLMFCYHYDPKGKKYAIMATQIMKLAGALTVLLLSLYFLFSFRKKN